MLYHWASHYRVVVLEVILNQYLILLILFILYLQLHDLNTPSCYKNQAAAYFKGTSVKQSESGEATNICSQQE